MPGTTVTFSRCSNATPCGGVIAELTESKARDADGGLVATGAATCVVKGERKEKKLGAAKE
jgi:hypothetical protein